jgi:hypothetical protein
LISVAELGLGINSKWQSQYLMTTAKSYIKYIQHALRRDNRSVGGAIYCPPPPSSPPAIRAGRLIRPRRMRMGRVSLSSLPPPPSPSLSLRFRLRVRMCAGCMLARCKVTYGWIRSCASKEYTLAHSEITCTHIKLANGNAAGKVLQFRIILGAASKRSNAATHWHSETHLEGGEVGSGPRGLGIKV